MCSSMYHHTFKSILFLSCCLQVFILIDSSSSRKPLCHEDERLALMKFKDSFIISKGASSHPSAYPKVESWKLEGENSDCCLWDGVECDLNGGHVVGLDLRSSFLLGSFHSNSSIFNLVHLQRLNLADNLFNHSVIPSEIGRFSGLTSLNLSGSQFSGLIPRDISKLSKLLLLDLSNNFDASSSLKLGKHGLSGLLHNLSSLEELYLGKVSISSEIPGMLANLSSLKVLDLEDCELFGKFPPDIFYLPNLKVLSLPNNPNLGGQFPEFHPNNSLEVLRFASSNFSGKLPLTTRNLMSLKVLDIYECGLEGSIPASLGNLTKLTYLDLESNSFTGDIPSLAGLSKINYLSLSYNEFNPGTLPWIGMLKELDELYLFAINLHGSLSSFVGNLTSQITTLLLSFNHLTGEIPTQLMNLTRLNRLELMYNKLEGPVPSSFSQLKSLQALDLSFNNFTGRLNFEIFFELKDLFWLQLSENKLTVVTGNSTISNSTLPQFYFVGLASCGLQEFPEFLRFQDRLKMIYLEYNEIHGEVPAWFLNTSLDTFGKISLNGNFLTSFEQLPDILPWHDLSLLDLSHNMLQGPLPIPPLSTRSYSVAKNKLTGEIPPSICELSSMNILDLSLNDMVGALPPCLSKMSSSLVTLNVKGNKFHGPIPPIFSGGNKLKMIDFSDNQLEGVVPRSLASCDELVMLDLSNNLIKDTFPFWLGGLQKLEVLLLKSNKFYGEIKTSKLAFPNIRIIDLSHNNFRGDIPEEYIRNWNAMKFFDVHRMGYKEADVSFDHNRLSFDRTISYSMTITNKGVDTQYRKIWNAFTAIDLSSNKFKGEIPESIGNLRGLQLLNLSHNGLTGPIPSSIGDLRQLESLDFSQNKLSGEIPQQMSLLNFLEVLNLSNNCLSGPIPRGKQFLTFQNDSFGGNVDLCGEPLSKKCEKSVKPPHLDTGSGSDSVVLGRVEWIIISLGYAGGTVVGVVMGLFLTTKYHEWFVQTFGRKQHNRRRRRRQGN